MNERAPLARLPLVQRVNALFAWGASLALVAMMLVTFAAVIMRYVWNAPVLGGNELIQLLSVAVVTLAMPCATQSETHVRVDVLDGAIGRHGRFFGDLIARGLGGYVIWQLVARSWTKMSDAAEYGDATNMLQIPLWPFYGLITIGFGLCILVLVLQAIDILLRGPH